MAKKKKTIKERLKSLEKKVFAKDTSRLYEYKHFIKSAAENDSNLPIPNSDFEHRMIVEEAMIKKAKNFIRIFTGSMKEVKSTLDLINKYHKNNPNLKVEVLIAKKEVSSH